MPIITMWAPTSDDFGSASLRLSRSVLLERREPALAQPRRRHVDLDVELPELGDELRVGDRRQRLGVLQRGVAVVVDEVELDLEAGHRVVGVEPRLAQHPGEDVEAAAYLLPVPGAVGAGELLCGHFFAHAPTLGRFRRLGDPSLTTRGRARHGSPPTRAGGNARRQQVGHQPGERMVGVGRQAPVDRAPGERAVAAEPAANASTAAACATSPSGAPPDQVGPEPDGDRRGRPHGRRPDRLPDLGHGDACSSRAALVASSGAVPSAT